MADELVALFVALAVAALGTGLLIPVLRRVQLMDVPNHRSSHVDATPRGGGIGLLVAVLLTVAVVAVVSDDPPVPVVTVLVAAVALALVGLVDDARSLPSRYRLLAQVVTAVGVASVATSNVAGVGPLVAVVSTLGYVSYVNAYNFMDGVNGISALSAIVAGAWYWWLAGEHPTGTAVVAAALAGAASGFLPWNLRGRVFLGDVGSYGVGALVAGLAVVSWAAGAPAVLAIAPLLVYLADTAAALLTRALRGEPLGVPHRGHVYQRLVDGGWSHLAASSWCAGASALVCGAVAVGGPGAGGLAVVGLVVAAYLVSPLAAVRSRAVRIEP